MHEDLIIQPLDKRPDLIGLLRQLNVWPLFLDQDPIFDLYWETFERDFAEHVLVAYDESAPDIPVARALSVPFEFGTEQRPELPNDGWDAVIRWAALDRILGRTPTVVSALEVAVHPDRQGEGLSAVMLAAMCENARRLGFTELVAPVRPSHKAHEPHLPIREYVARVRPDGLPEDPWLRTHVRAGGEIIGVCSRAMMVCGTLAEWRHWTGLPFDRTGDVIVPEALVPVVCDLDQDYATYLEPNVWVRHRLNG